MYTVKSSTSSLKSRMEWLRYKKKCVLNNHKSQVHSKVCNENEENEEKNDYPLFFVLKGSSLTGDYKTH